MSIKTKPSAAPVANPRRNYTVIGGIIGTAVVVAFLLILVSTNTGGSDFTRFAGLDRSRTADGGFVVGNPDAPITLVEFADYACPACQDYKPTMDEFIERYVKTGKAKYEYRTLMTAGGETTGYAYSLAVCAEEQREGAFWEANELLFDYGARGAATYNANMARPFAERLGLDLGRLLTCAPGSDQIQQDLALARQAGVSATPTVLVRYGDSQAIPLPGGRGIEDLGILVEAANLQ